MTNLAKAIQQKVLPKSTATCPGDVGANYEQESECIYARENLLDKTQHFRQHLTYLINVDILI